MHNRIKELREVRGWSMDDLAARANTGSSTISKLEKGKTRLTIEWIERLAKAFNVPPEEIAVFSNRKAQERRDDAVPYDGHIAELKLSTTQRPYLVVSDSLDELDIKPGIILIVDIEPSEVAKISSGDIVVAQDFENSGDKMLLRQFVAPNLLVTNSSNENAPLINMRRSDAIIKGIVVAAHHRFPGRAKVPSGP